MGTGQSRVCGPEGHQSHGERPDDEPQLQEQLQHIRHKILVMSGKGGVGKTSVAVYLALGLARRGYRVGLLDIDIHGPDVPRMLGLRGMFETDAEQRLIPHQYNDHLGVFSIECLLHDRDQAVIWRGPLKHSYIRQAVSQVHWGELDFLVIDAPPGTGDEPLSVAQTITGALALIVTTPQEISLADVRKAINFCRKVNMPILGLVENMSGLICPHCGGEIALFRRGGGARTATATGVPLLASLPFDLQVMERGDAGRPLLETPSNSPFLPALQGLLDEVEDLVRLLAAQALPPAAATASVEEARPTGNCLKVAVPLAQGMLCNHFGHCETFAVVHVQENIISTTELHTPPPHEPGVLPRWLADLGVHLIIASGMGQRAMGLFAEKGIRVVTGAPNLEPEALVQSYLAGSLATGPNVCDH